MTAPGYVVILICHVLSALVGFGALGMTGRYASNLRRMSRPLESAALQRFFREGFNLAAASIGAVPIFGAVLLVLGPRSDVHALFPWAGLVLWLVALAISASVTWPAERAIQRLFSRGASGDEELARGLARRCEAGAAGAIVCSVAALVLMVAQV